MYEEVKKIGGKSFSKEKESHKNLNNDKVGNLPSINNKGGMGR